MLFLLCNLYAGDGGNTILNFFFRPATNTNGHFYLADTYELIFHYHHTLKWFLC